MTDTATSYAELRKLADAVLQTEAAMLQEGGAPNGEVFAAGRAFRLSANPQAVLALLDELDALRGYRDECERQFQEKVQQVLDEMHRTEAAEAKAQAMREALEPFAAAALTLDMMAEWRQEEQPAFYTSVEGFDAAAPITISDFRRARAAYERITP